MLERHRLGTQTFILKGGARFVMLVAMGGAAPDVTILAALTVTGEQAVTLRAGTWQHGLNAPQDGDFVIVERHAAETDCDLATLDETVTLVLPE